MGLLAKLGIAIVHPAILEAWWRMVDDARKATQDEAATAALRAVQRSLEASLRTNGLCIVGDSKVNPL